MADRRKKRRTESSGRGAASGQRRARKTGFGSREMFIVTAPGMEAALEDELADVGLRGTVDTGGITLQGQAADMRTVHLYSRIASSVRVRVARGRAEGLNDIARVVRAGAWKHFLHPSQPVRINVSASDGLFRLRGPVVRKVEVAIRDALRGPRLPGPRPPREEAVVHVRIAQGKVIVSVDATGDPMHKRGWRRDSGRAPIRENLAAAILRLADWDPGVALVDPMCGSGTFVIEAATISLGQAPGGSRRFAFERFPCHDAAAFKKEQAASSSGVLDATAPILGGDREEGAILAARKNAKRANVADRVGFQQCAFRDLVPPASTGLIVTNPPYGKRVGQSSVIGAMYRDFGRCMRENWSGWRIAILLPTARTVGALDLPVEEVTRFKNGQLPVALYTGYVP